MKNNEMKENGNTAREMLFMLAEVTKEPALLLKKALIELDEKVDLVALNMSSVTDDQYNGLINMIEQFSQAVDDYITENNIQLKEKN